MVRRNEVSKEVRYADMVKNAKASNFEKTTKPATVVKRLNGYNS